MMGFAPAQPILRLLRLLVMYHNDRKSFFTDGRLILFCRTQLRKLGYASCKPLRKARWLIQTT